MIALTGEETLRLPEAHAPGTCPCCGGQRLGAGLICVGCQARIMALVAASPGEALQDRLLRERNPNVLAVARLHAAGDARRSAITTRLQILLADGRHGT